MICPAQHYIKWRSWDYFPKKDSAVTTILKVHCFPPHTHTHNISLSQTALFLSTPRSAYRIHTYDRCFFCNCRWFLIPHAIASYDIISRGSLYTSVVVEALLSHNVIKPSSRQREKQALIPTINETRAGVIWWNRGGPLNSLPQSPPLTNGHMGIQPSRFLFFCRAWISESHNTDQYWQFKVT